jgi:hypothetical protein
VFVQERHGQARLLDDAGGRVVAAAAGVAAEVLEDRIAFQEPLAVDVHGLHRSWFRVMVTCEPALNRPTRSHADTCESSTFATLLPTSLITAMQSPLSPPGKRGKFRDDLARAIERTRELRTAMAPDRGLDYILAQLEGIEARTRDGKPLPRELRERIAFDVVAARELDHLDDYAELLSRLAAFARDWSGPRNDASERA